MADHDELPDARDPQVAGWLAVEPLDDVTRHRLVRGALDATRPDTTAPDLNATRARPSRTWSWIAAAAAVVVLLVGGLALLTAEGGHDEQATRPTTGEQTALAAAPTVGDFGDLGQAVNRDAARRALTSAGALASSADVDAQAPAGASAPTAADRAEKASPALTRTCAAALPSGTIDAQATGTLDGHPAVVVLVTGAAGAQQLVVLTGDPCTARTFP
jgi:hypothetical protein